MNKKEQLKFNKENPIIHFYKDRNGEIIGRYFNGKKAYIRSNTVKVKDGEDWRCKIISYNTRSVTVEPINLLITKNENEELFIIKANILKEKYSEI